jgi:hypothetical protein
MGETESKIERKTKRPAAAGDTPQMRRERRGGLLVAVCEVAVCERITAELTQEMVNETLSEIRLRHLRRMEPS